MATIRPALWVALAGQLLVLGAAAAGWLGMTPATVAAIACSIIAAVSCAELAGRGALIAGHGVAAAILAAGLAPGAPATVALAGWPRRWWWASPGWRRWAARWGARGR